MLTIGEFCWKRTNYHLQPLRKLLERLGVRVGFWNSCFNVIKGVIGVGPSRVGSGRDEPCVGLTKRTVDHSNEPSREMNELDDGHFRDISDRFYGRTRLWRMNREFR